ncbi:trypsin-like serine peptidase [Rhizobium leguminosarum]
MITLYRAIVFFVILMGSASSLAKAEQNIWPGPYQSGKIIPVGEADGTFKRRPGGRLSYVYSQDTAKAVKARVSVPPSAKLDLLEVRNANGTTVERIDPRTFSGREFWTSTVAGPTLTIVGGPDTNWAIPRVTGLIVDTGSFNRESIIGPNQLEDVVAYKGKYLAIVSTVEKAIGSLSFVDGDIGYVCTAFMLNKSWAMTNDHCVGTEAVCATATLSMGYEILPDNTLSGGTAFRCKRIVLGDYGLDFAILEVEGEPGQAFGSLELAAHAPSADEDAFVVQHPNGEPKKISSVDCAIHVAEVMGRTATTDNTHTCDTAGGSSGSPVIDASGKVIALHHLGKSKTDPNFYEINRAVEISKILEFVANHDTQINR